MGFSLEQMVKDLEMLLSSEAVPDRLIVEAVSERLAWWKEYAKECGQLSA